MHFNLAINTYSGVSGVTPSDPQTNCSGDCKVGQCCRDGKCFCLAIENRLLDECEGIVIATFLHILSRNLNGRFCDSCPIFRILISYDMTIGSKQPTFNRIIIR